MKRRSPTLALPLPPLLLLLQAFCLSAPSVGGASEDAAWPSFRGPEAVRTSDNARLPLHWSTEKNVEWVTDVPGLGWSSPIVVAGRVFLTTATSKTTFKEPQIGTEYSNDYVAELMKEGLSQEEVMARVEARDMEMPDEIELEYWLLAFDLESGEETWRKKFFAGPPPGGRHRKNSFTSETPVSDGKSVFVYVGNLGLWSFSLDGEENWSTLLESFPIYLDFGTGGSPVTAHGKLFIQNDNQSDQFVAAFDTETGEELWRVHRELAPPDQKNRRSGWTTPFVWETPERTELVTHGPYTVVSYDLEGEELWRMSGHSILPAPSPFAYDGLLYLVSGVHGDENRPIAAIRPGASGDLTLSKEGPENPSVVFFNRVAGTYIPTPVAYKGALWVLYDRGIFARHDAATGERTFRARIDGSAGAFTASPWAYRDRVFGIDEEGTTFVFGTGDEFDQLHTNELDEMVLATPAIVGDRLLIRTQTRLYSLRENTASENADRP
ncbi:MAG: PQQ-binding-like beta-propeller repeat protein [Acidobacteriota bacterium]